MIVTRRQKQIIDLLREGKGRNKIAAAIGRSELTVYCHFQALIRKGVCTPGCTGYGERKNKRVEVIIPDDQLTVVGRKGDELTFWNGQGVHPTIKHQLETQITRGDTARQYLSNLKNTSDQTGKPMLERLVFDGDNAKKHLENLERYYAISHEFSQSRAKIEDL